MTILFSYQISACAENAVLDKLLSDGISVSEKEAIKLPQPLLADGVNAVNQRKTIESVLAGKYAWEDFTRKAVVAPFVLKISGDTDRDSRLARTVDVYFVAYGELKTLASDDFLTGQLKLAGSDGDAANGSFVKMLTDADLRKRGLPLPKSTSDPRFIAADITLLERVRLNATMLNAKSETADSVLVASMLDDQFAEDKEFPIAWRSITRDDSGKRKVGPPQEYRGLGFYVKATRLNEPAGALFIEYHAAFAEPQGWFSGVNLLRSKLPIVVQDSVRKARRSLEK